MKIIIPMSGKGKRYNDAAFHGPKPLIEIDGKPMIQHVVNLFSPQDEFIFICNEHHLQTTNMQEIITKLVPKYKIISVTDEQIAGGPIHTCSHAFNLIEDDEEVIVNYCDFVVQWNYEDFLAKVRSIPCAGAIPSFKGFHPASLGDTYYAYLKADKENYITELREKEPFSENRMNDYASTGTYYFKNGSLLKKYAKQVMDLGMNVKGEAYVTLPYILMIQAGLNILNYEVEKFICLGTPRDYEIYKFWSEFFFRQSGQVVGFNNVNIKTTNIFPIAGDKREFKSLSFDAPNFLIPIMNQPLITSTVRSYPKGIRNIFICLENHKKQYQLDTLLKGIFYNSELVTLNAKTEGNALTILNVEDIVDSDAPVCLSGCSYILEYDERRLSHLMENEDIDVILLCFTHHECVLRNPHNHSYIKLKNGVVEKVSEKMVISGQPYRDYAFTGTVIYKKAADLFTSIKKNIQETPEGTEKQDSRTYSFLTAINKLIEEGKKVIVFEVDKFISLLNITDYQEFVYWQEYFNDVPHHPYYKEVHQDNKAS